MKQTYLMYLVFIAAVLASCVSPEEGGEIALGAVDRIHTEFNSGNFDTIWNQADVEFRNAFSQNQMNSFLGDLCGKLGNEKSTQTKGYMFKKNLRLELEIFLKQRTEFERGEATETFAFLIKDQQALLRRYTVSQDDMIIRK